MKVITCVEDAVAAIGQLLGVGEWKIIDQQRIDSFADVTEDHQWIHLDAVRAAAESPYGATVAHGFLTLALLPRLSKTTFRVENARMGINYGLNKVRLLSPVKAGNRIRVRSDLLSADVVDDRTVNMTVRHTIEVDGSDTPAVVTDLIARYVF
ncbi:MaoC family dehydratase [Mycolicibacterium sp. CH28]|uniref:MaoC family dehydratase n=1 Tax=Mycolicibacterium sp. CH28 TaxID=2512237 RepID=UPI00108182B0|nr:MaoC family dehydratase [Mycolicibacterium sp. CH28]TGD87075.1 MaoC family dehydratase [Mycolicibacterium sp. CH28]